MLEALPWEKEKRDNKNVIRTNAAGSLELSWTGSATSRKQRKEKSEALGSGRVYTQCVIYYQTKDITIKSNQKPSLDPTTGI